MIVDGDVNMVEDVVVVRGGELSADDTCILGVTSLVYITSHWEPCAAVMLTILHGIAPGHWHVVHNPVVLVVHKHSLSQQGNLLLIL